MNRFLISQKRIIAINSVANRLHLCKTSMASASLPSVSCYSIRRYLSVRFLEPIIGLILFHSKSGGAGSSRGGHVGWIAVCVASSTV